MAFLIFIYHRTPKFEDNYFIQNELRYQFIALSIMYTAYTFTFSYLCIVQPDDPITLQLILSIESNVVILCQWTCLMIATYWVHLKLSPIMESQSYRKLTKSYLKFGRTLNSLSITDQILNDKDVELVHISPQLSSMNKSKSNGTSNGINESLNNSMNFLQKSLQKVNGQIDGTPDLYQRAPSRPSEELEQFTLEQVLGHRKSFELYMVHLSKELSLESLLSILEFIEFQKMVLHLMESEKSENVQSAEDLKRIIPDNLWCHTFVLPDTLPQSAIVRGDARGKDALEDCKIKAWALFTKYVQKESDFEINIPGEMRAKFETMMQDYERWVKGAAEYDLERLLLLFEPLIEQMTTLLYGSFRRFQETEEFHKLTTLIML